MNNTASSSRKYKVAVITPTEKLEYLTETVIDGLFRLMTDRYPIQPAFCLEGYKSEYPAVAGYALARSQFLEFAKDADLIFLLWGKGCTNFKLAEEIGRWDRTVFLDGSELAKDRRYDHEIRAKVLSGEWVDNGKIDRGMLSKCSLYFRREKPYVHGITPLPYGIESKFTAHYDPGIKKDIDFFCVFGQEEYPVLRKQAREALIKFCAGNNFTCVTEKTKDRTEFYKLLARSKVGISVGGGGFDTARFWEILGNNCLLLTETIDIYEPGSDALKYRRIFEFKDIDDLNVQLHKVGALLKSGYPPAGLTDEYNAILKGHSSKARVMTVLEAARAKGLIGSVEPVPAGNAECAIIVSSCDAFEDAWRPFFTLLFRYWPDCPFPVYLVTNEKKYNDSRVNTIAVGDDKRWASNMKKALGSVPAGHILYLQEDYFLEKKVDTAAILRLFNEMKDWHAAYLRLVPSPKPDIVHAGGIGELSRTAPYRTSLQGAFWDKEILNGLLKEGESGWDMEVKGTERSRAITQPFLSVTDWALPYFRMTAIKKGRWYYDAVQLLKKEGIDVDPTKRPVEPFGEYLWRRLTSVPLVGRTARRIVRKLFS